MTNRPSRHQLEALVDFLEEHPGIARGLLRTSQAKFETRRKWNHLSQSLNSLGGVSKDGSGWAKYWAEKKCHLKKLCAQRSSSMRRTGGGVDESTIMLSDLDKRFVACLGGTNFAAGDEEVQVNSFPRRPSAPEVDGTPPSAEPEEEPIPIVIEIEDEGMSVEREIPEPIPTVSNSSTNAPRQRTRRREASSADVQLERMASMEEKRIQAEIITAQALADTSTRIEQLSNAAEHIAQSIREVAHALLQIANNMPNRQS